MSEVVAGTVLVTGAAGYLGSVASYRLLELGFTVIGVDDYSKGRRSIISKLKEFGGTCFSFESIDLRSEQQLMLLEKYDFDYVLHFAGVKSVRESQINPSHYFETNIGGTGNLCKQLSRKSIKGFVFSSSATVYGAKTRMPVAEESECCPANFYGQTKLEAEQVLTEFAKEKRVPVVSLRYFNPAGASANNIFGDNPVGEPENLIPILARSAITGVKFKIFGDNYETVDGTCVRDYIHVEDLIDAHLVVLTKVFKSRSSKDFAGRNTVFNVGVGQGFSVRQVIDSFNEIISERLVYTVADRRPGDVAELYSDSSKIERTLGWKATRTLAEICESEYKFVKENFGFAR